MSKYQGFFGGPVPTPAKVVVVTAEHFDEGGNPWCCECGKNEGKSHARDCVFTRIQPGTRFMYGETMHVVTRRHESIEGDWWAEAESPTQNTGEWAHPGSYISEHLVP